MLCISDNHRRKSGDINLEDIYKYILTDRPNCLHILKQQNVYYLHSIPLTQMF